MINTLRGTRPFATGLIAAVAVIGASLAATAPATASTAAPVSTSAHEGNTAAPSAKPTGRGPSLAQAALLEQRAKLGAHASLTDPGLITGSVAGFDGQPVPGACVTAVSAGHAVTTTAAPDGTYRLAGLTAGSYALEYRDCSAAGRNLTSAAGYLTTWSGGAAAQNTAARVQITAGQVRHVPAVTLRPANPAAAIAAAQASFRHELAANSRTISAAAAAKTGHISGKVTGKGKPLSGICVTVAPTRIGRGYAAKTGKNGTYTVRHVLPGRYHVFFAGFFCASHTNWLLQVYKDDNHPSALLNNGGTIVKVRAGHTTVGINGKLRLGGEISGTVTGKSGSKLRGICVSTAGQLSSEVSFGINSQTAANGIYHIYALFPGKYSVQFSIGCGSRGSNYAPATHRPVKVGLGQNVTVNQKLVPGASITGKVTLTSNSGTPLSGICVEASNASGSVDVFTSTNHDGSYRLIGLTAGRFQMEFSPGCRNNGNYTSASLTAHTTAGKQTSDINAVLQTGAIIHGTITSSGGKAVRGICIEIDTANSGAGYPGSDANGTYRIDQLPAGKYQVGFYGGCGNRGSYAPNWYQNQPSEGTASWIRLTAGQSFPLDVQLQPGATITGKVTSGGNGLSGVCVYAESQTNSELGIAYPGQTYTRHGIYTIANLAPGQYQINFGCGYGRYGEQWFPGAPDAAAADLVSAPAGLTANINAALQPGGTIKGVVTGKAGHPLPGICVFALNTKGTVPALGASTVVGLIVSNDASDIPAFTGSHGTYTISGLAAGRYKVLFGPCFNGLQYAEQWYRGKASPRAATDVTVRAGKTTPGIDGHLVVGGTISGHVTGNGGKPQRNVCVIAINPSTGGLGAGIAATGAAGTYTIAGLSSGRYTVEFVPCGNQNLVAVFGNARVTAQHATTGVNAAMHPGGSIAGVVTAGSASGPDVSATCVEVYSGTSAEPVDTAFTGLNGSYLATGLPVGTYEVYFGDPQCNFTPNLAPQWYDGQLTRATATKVSVTAVGSTTSSVDAALQADGEITGTVSGKSAGPLSGVCVTAVPLSGGAPSASGSLPIVAVTRATGYTLARLVPGRYKVKFSSGCGATGYATQWWKQKTSQKSATVITVGPGQDTSAISATLR